MCCGECGAISSAFLFVRTNFRYHVDPSNTISTPRKDGAIAIQRRPVTTFEKPSPSPAANGFVTKQHNATQAPGACGGHGGRDIIAHVPAGEKDDIDRAVVATRRAFESGPWSRAQILRPDTQGISTAGTAPATICFPTVLSVWMRAPVNESGTIVCPSRCRGLGYCGASDSCRHHCQRQKKSTPSIR